MWIHKSKDTIFFSIYILLLSFGIYNHEPWRDEIQEFLMCIKSETFSIFLSNRITNAHPLVWELVLFIVSRFTSDVNVIQILNAIISIVSIIIVYKLKYFNKLQFWLFAFGNYLLFEYTLIARNYSSELLLIVLSFYCYEKKSKYLFLVIGLLANTNILGLIISGVLFLNIIINEKFNIKLKHLTYLILALISLSDLFYQVYVWGHFNSLNQQNTVYNLEWFSQKLSLIYRGFIPIPNFWEFHFWNTNILDMVDINYLKNNFSYFSKLEPWLFIKRGEQLFFIKQIVSVMLSLLLLIGVIISFWKNKKLIFFFFMGSIPMWILFAFIWEGSIRHWGHFFILYLVCYWFLIQNRNQTRFSKWFLTGILTLQIPGGFHAYYMDYKYEFSGSKKVADKITPFLKEKSFIVGVSDFTTTPISYYINKKFYSPEYDDTVSFVKWKPCIEPISNDSLFKAFKMKYYIDKKSPSFLIINRKSGFEELNKYNLTSYLGHNTSSYKEKISVYKQSSIIVEDETYATYMWNNNKNDSIGCKISSYMKPLLNISKNDLFHSNNLCFHIDFINKKIDEVNISGWAFLNGTSPEKTSTYIYVQSPQVTYFFDTKKIFRKDVNKNEMVGFQCMVFQSELQEGFYKIGIIIYDQKNNNLSVQQTEQSVELCQP